MVGILSYILSLAQVALFLIMHRKNRNKALLLVIPISEKEGSLLYRHKNVIPTFLPKTVGFTGVS